MINTKLTKKRYFLKRKADHTHQLESMSWLAEHYKIIMNFAKECSKTVNEEALLKKAYEMVSEVIPTDSFYLAVPNEAENNIDFLILMEDGQPLPKFSMEYGENNTTRVIKSRKIIHHRIQEDDDMKTMVGRVDTISHLFVPIIIDDHVKAVISAQSFKEFAYRKEHEELLQLIGAQVMTSIETARLYEETHTLSNTDELTGLKNQRAFNSHITKQLEENISFALIMLDLDNLKGINDLYGHETGDLYLKTFAEGIKSICGTGIEGFRYAGDEFMLIVNTQDTDVTTDVYTRLDEYLFSNPICASGNKIAITYSSGLSIYPDHGSSVEKLKKTADQALYSAKQNGKNQNVIFNCKLN